MIENPLFHDKMKHIEIWYFYIRDLVQKGAIKLQYVGTDEKFFDILTKPLSQMKFEYFHDKIGVFQKEFHHKEEKWWDYKWWTLFEKGISGLRHEPSSDKGGAGWYYETSEEICSNYETDIDDGWPWW